MSTVERVAQGGEASIADIQEVNPTTTTSTLQAADKCDEGLILQPSVSACFQMGFGVDNFLKSLPT